jgi:hypothetical protein
MVLDFPSTGQAVKTHPDPPVARALLHPKRPMNPRELGFAALALALLIPVACSPTEPRNPLAVAGHTFDLTELALPIDQSLPYVYEPVYFLGCWTSDGEYWAAAAEDTRLDAVQNFFRNASESRLTIIGATRCRTEDGVLSGWSDYAYESDGPYQQRGDTLDFFLSGDRRKLAYSVILWADGTRYEPPWLGWIVTPPGGHSIYQPGTFVRR